MRGLRVDQLVVGHVYRVEFQDCCTGGFFIDTLTGIDGDDEASGELKFAWGQIRGWSCIEEVAPDAARA